MKDLHVNQMLSEVDHLVRNLFPCFLEAAGLKDEAARIRKLPTLRSRVGVSIAMRMMRAIAQKPLCRDPSWIPLVEDAAFWAEASIVTAAVDNRVDCPACVLFLKRTMDESFARFSEH